MTPTTNELRDQLDALRFTHEAYKEKAIRDVAESVIERRDDFDVLHTLVHIPFLSNRPGPTRYVDAEIRVLPEFDVYRVEGQMLVEQQIREQLV